VERGQQPRLLVIVVVALGPFRFGQRRVLLVPGARVLVGPQLALHGVRAAVAERFVQAADAVVQRGDEHQVAGRPGVEVPVREHAGHPEFGHLRHVVPPDHLPLVGEDRIDPGVVRAVADGVVVQIGHRFVQVVQHLRMPLHVRVQHVLGELERGAHCIAVIVVRDVFAPVDQARVVLPGMREVPLVDVHHLVAAVDLDDRRDERDQIVADRPDVLVLVHGEPVGELHQRGWRAGFRRVDRAGDVVDRRGSVDELLRLRVVHVDRARVGKLREACAVLLQPRHDGVRRDRDRDHLAAFLGLADRVDLHARARFLEHAHVLIDLFRVRELAGRTRHVAEHRFGCRHVGRGRQIVSQRRIEIFLGGVLGNLLCVFLVDRLIGIASGFDLRICQRGRRDNEERRQQCRAQQEISSHVWSSCA